ncbi:hypothetical protein BUALT_Bualt03G0191700 [Buddleja alternifolia]|uniref:HTH myb-type domain-containing protein n=1 Tax=Buddleja alternifolia TaxID=168488 RepID=A0AAV6XX81_9LAMI|nr:hypothetical protein BUALT_Bualt03G0191700 [Buddleja alternifolia]
MGICLTLLFLDFFVGIKLDLEMEPKIKAEFSVSTGEESEFCTNATIAASVDKVNEENNSSKEEKAPSVSASASASNLCSGSSLVQGEETVRRRVEFVGINTSSGEADKGRKSSAHLKSHLGKKKVKVDWTPELHRQFVQAVEQLGVDKAVPSRILELMGIDCLTRHNIASHLQKYRSQRKHLLAQEAEVASWRRRRQTYRPTGGTCERDVNSCVVPTTGFPPVAPLPHFRPLHVWGHPCADQSLMYMWPNHPSSPSPPPPSWAPAHVPPAALPGDTYFWYCHHQDVPAPGMPCFPPPFPATGYPTPPVPGIQSTTMYRVDPRVGVPSVPTGRTLPKAPFDFEPSKESVDAVIGDVLSQPWLPLPLGLKPPSIDSVMVELQRQGISKIPPCA